MKEVKISLEQIKELREKTLIGIKDCKDALIRAKGDIEEAENILIKTGRMKVNARLNRKSDDGAVFTYLDSEKAAMLVQTCETNSVALNKRFRSSGQSLVEIAANNKSNEITEERNCLHEYCKK